MTATATPKSSGRALMWFGLLAAFAGIGAYVIQFSAKQLTTPWYMPALATLGVVLVAWSIVRARTIWRILALIFVVLLAGFEWTLMFQMQLPAYAGPAKIGKALPAFVTARADGS